ncbi:MAG: hypothetical protein LWX56_05660 [Ignavibacteria bacterium]|nr:hypothetical protein [Ignavibacteria bacterium]
MVKYLSLIYLICASLLYSQDVKVKVSTDASQYQLGDHIKYDLTINCPKNSRAILPSVKDSLGKIEFVALDKGDTINNPDGSYQMNYHFRFISFDSGRVVIPSISIPYSANGVKELLTARTDSVVLNISGVKIDTTAELKDIKQPMTEPVDWLLFFIIALVVVIFVAGLFYLIKRYRAKMKGIVIERKEIIPPYEEALSRLRFLESQKLWQAGKVKEYHTEITGIIRWYFDRTFSIPALEMTSSEIIEKLRGKNLNSFTITTTQQFLENADMVKFAKFIPVSSVNEEMMKQAFAIIEEQKKIFHAEVSAIDGKGEQA